MGKNVAVFVDVANIFYAAKAAGVDIDYVTLLKSASAGRDLVRAYAYTGLDPDNENQRNFHDFLRRSNYKVVSKDIRKYGDGKVKANLDIELVVDMMKTARNLDIAIVVSGDGDFAPAIRAVQEQGVRVEVISFRGNTSSDLIEVADLFTDIVQLARVEKGPAVRPAGRRRRCGPVDDRGPRQADRGHRRRARRRGRGRGRGRDAEPVAARAAVAAGAATERAGPVAATAGARRRPGRAAGRAAVACRRRPDRGRPGRAPRSSPSTTSPRRGRRRPSTTAAGRGTDRGRREPRRRRRRGGRGRGRGRGAADEPEDSEAARDGRGRPSDRASSAEPIEIAAEEDEDEVVPRRVERRGRTPFGSVWDSQLGTPSAPSAAALTPDRRRRGFRRAGDPGVPDRRAAPRGRTAERRVGAGPAAAGPPTSRPWSASATAGVERAAESPAAVARDQSLPGRERPGRGRPTPRATIAATAAPDARPGANDPAQLERAVERRAAGARGDAPGPGRPEASPVPAPASDGPGGRVPVEPVEAGATRPRRDRVPSRRRRRSRPQAEHAVGTSRGLRRAGARRTRRRPGAARREAGDRRRRRLGAATARRPAHRGAGTGRGASADAPAAGRGDRRG